MFMFPVSPIFFVVVQLLTDYAFGYAWDRQAKINSQYKDTYTYIQAFKSLNSSIPDWMGK